ncbi:Uncharacterized protein dnm_022510 [Desulfonema magnum]|uniref:Uncharacterized protein n=1 Tax=Desulfonema magnum TaxID=45655 RepID=A0A975BJG8_9BACT|nr:Uncharacterized protein dnm_022510 [Desulfonema magnum]
MFKHLFQIVLQSRKSSDPLIRVRTDELQEYRKFIIRY